MHISEGVKFWKEMKNQFGLLSLRNKWRIVESIIFKKYMKYKWQNYVKGINLK
jgi:hypothetical protein